MTKATCEVTLAEKLLEALWDRSPEAWDTPDAYSKFRDKVTPFITEVLKETKGEEEALAELVAKLGCSKNEVPLWGPTK